MKIILVGQGFPQWMTIIPNIATGSMVLLYMVTWIPSIYPLYVSIFLPAPWILWDIVEPPTIIWDLAATFLQGALCQRVWKKGTTLKWGMLPEVTRCFSNRFQEKHITQILSWVFLPSHRSFIKLVEDLQESPSMNGEIARVSSPFKCCWYLHEKYLHEIPINQLIYNMFNSKCLYHDSK